MTTRRGNHGRRKEEGKRQTPNKKEGKKVGLENSEQKKGTLIVVTGPP